MSIIFRKYTSCYLKISQKVVGAKLWPLISKRAAFTLVFLWLGSIFVLKHKRLIKSGRPFLLRINTFKCVEFYRHYKIALIFEEAFIFLKLSPIFHWARSVTCFFKISRVQNFDLVSERTSVLMATCSAKI